MSEEKLTMDDFSAELEASFKKIEEGDMLTGTVISVDEKEVILDLKYYAEGVIRAEDFSNEPGFSLKDAVQVGDETTATVIRKDDGHGNILLSRADNFFAGTDGCHILNRVICDRHPGIALSDGELRREIAAEHSGKSLCGAVCFVAIRFFCKIKHGRLVFPKGVG